MSKDDLAANIEKMSLSELAALEAEAIQTAAATILPHWSQMPFPMRLRSE